MNIMMATGIFAAVAIAYSVFWKKRSKNMQISEDMLRIGVISSTHGIRGEVKVFPTTEDAKRFGKLKKVYLNYESKGMRGGLSKECVELEVSGVKYFKQFVIVKFRGIDDINDVEKYKGMELYVSREDAIPLDEGEYYIADLIGLKVVEEEGEEIGQIEDVLQTGANDVYVVKGNGKYANKEILLPAIKQCILGVDIENNMVKIHLMEGLLDL